MTYEDHMRRAIALSREKMREDEGDPTAHAEFALPPAERALPSERLLAEEALAVFEEWAADPDRVRY